jgi:inner membrane protein
VDNLTHTLIGFAAGHSINALRRFTRRNDERNNTTPSETDRRRGGQVALLASVMGNNFPDGDVIFSPLLGDGRLGSLLHHRGFTHTVLAAPVLAVAIVALTFLLLQRKPVSFREGMFAWFVGMLGVLLHIMADSWNDYGVHPFVPFDNHWRYGDRIFIIEPLLWLSLLWALTPLGEGTLGDKLDRSRKSVIWYAVARRSIAVLSIGLLLFFPGMHWVLAAVGCSFFAGLILFQRFVRTPLARVLPPLMILFTFAMGSKAAKTEVLSNVVKQTPMASQGTSEVSTPINMVSTSDPLWRVMDVLASPSASNPWCWRVMVALKSGSGPIAEYETHMGTVSLWPELFAAEGCHIRGRKQSTYQLLSPRLASTEKVHWSAKGQLSVRTLVDLARRYCRVRRLMTFTRYPFAQQSSDGSWVVGDHRYDFDESLGFSEIRIDPNEESGDDCLHLPTPWQTWVMDDLEGAV